MVVQTPRVYNDLFEKTLLVASVFSKSLEFLIVRLMVLVGVMPP